MLAALEATGHACVPLSAFARQPTIEGLAERLQSTPEGAEEPLTVTLRAGDSRRPCLWLIHPVGGHVVFGQWLLPNMHASQPVMGIQARGLDGQRSPLRAIEEMAELYVDLVRSAQRGGPYLLAGPSMGGYIALEMAERLRAAGEEVALVALLDTLGPNYPRPTSRILRWSDSLRMLAGISGWRARLEKVGERLRARRGASSRAIPPRYDGFGALVDGKHGERGTLVRAIAAVAQANEAANAAYRPRPFTVPVVLLRAAHGMPWSGMRFDDPANGWRPLARAGIRAIQFPCQHAELVDEPPPEVGRALQAEIDRVLAARLQIVGPKCVPTSFPMAVTITAAERR
jgi:thioesterase domain-containing protein